MPSVPRVLHQGLAVDKPAADATVNQGWIYYETDTDTLRQSWNGTWTTINITSALVKLEEVVVGIGGAGSIAFASIPPSYRSLQLIGVARSSAAAVAVGINMQFNGDASANYDTEQLGGVGQPDGSFTIESVAGTSLSVGSPVANSGPADVADLVEIVIPNYSGTTFQKVFTSRQTSKRGTTANTVYAAQVSGWWRSTAAITDIVLAPTSGDFMAGSTFTLYGIG